MKRKDRILFLSFVLLSPFIAQAHSGPSLAAMPLGPLPFMMLKDSWIAVIPILAAVVTEWVVLWLLFRSLGPWRNLWRAAVLYLTVQVAECVFVMGLWVFGMEVSFPNTPECITMYLSSGMVPAILMGLILYRKTTTDKDRLWQLTAVAMATIAAYFAAFLCLYLIVKMVT